MSAAALADLAGIPPHDIALRQSRVPLGAAALLNHQKPLLMGRNKEAAFLDGHSLHSWAMQLDTRIYFAPLSKLAALKGSFDVPTVVFRIDTGRLFDDFEQYLFVSPINSGNADRRPALRGDWMYVPATASVQDFRTNRRRLGLVKGPNSVREISITRPIAPDVLRSLLT